MGSFMGGGKGGGSSERHESRAGAGAEQLAALQARIAEELYGQTANLRAFSLDTLGRVLGGERTENMRVFAPEREAVEAQFRNARNAIIEGSPTRGGQLNRSLADVELARAGTLGGLESDVRRNAMQQALSLGFGTPQVSLQGLAGGTQGYLGAGGIYGGAANRAAQQEQSKNQSIGAMAGLAAMLAFCWVAAALYGEDTSEFRRARYFIAIQWQGRLADLVRVVYRRCGPAVARLIHRWPIVGRPLRPLFDAAVQRSKGEL